MTINAFEDGDNLIVVGSYGGRVDDPDWAVNLRSTPMATVRRGRDALEHVVHEAEGGERARLWALVTEAFPLYETYQSRTERVIPLFVLEPRL